MGKMIKTSEISVDDRIRRAYLEWCEYYEKSYDEKRLNVFASNFLAVEKYHKQTEKSLVLNEFADMTESEYVQYLTTDAHFASPSTNTFASSITEKYRPPENKNLNDNCNSFLQDDSTTTIDLYGNNDKDPITSYLDP